MELIAPFAAALIFAETVSAVVAITLYVARRAVQGV